MRSALVLWGGWNGHDPEEFAAIYRRWLHEDGFSVRMETDPAVFGDPALNALSLIVPCYTMGELSDEHADNLAAAIASGTGMAGHHGGMAYAFRNSAMFQFITGGQMVAHPGDEIDYRVDIGKPDDPIMAGLKSFPYRSEQYYLHVDPANEVLATTTFSGAHLPWLEGVVMPVVWKKRFGRGRVFCSALGHRAMEFENTDMSTILRRGLNWAARDE